MIREIDGVVMILETFFGSDDRGDSCDHSWIRALGHAWLVSTGTEKVVVEIQYGSDGVCFGQARSSWIPKSGAVKLAGINEGQALSRAQSIHYCYIYMPVTAAFFLLHNVLLFFLRYSGPCRCSINLTCL